MNQTAIFWPMIVHALLVFVIYVLMLLRRRAAVEAGSARISDFRENRNEPPESLFVRNNLANQYELPVLFHVVCLALFATNGAGATAVTLAWLFVVSRYAHAYIHVTSNRIRHRQLAFGAGFFILALMWLRFALHIAGIV